MQLLQAISGEQYWSYRMHCIDPVIHPTSLNYIYESTSNEISILYEYLRGNQRGFRLKFSSNKPARKYVYWNNTIQCHMFQLS